MYFQKKCDKLYTDLMKAEKRLGKGVTWKMSQEKVERYKQEKANRKQIMKKQKIMSVLRKTVLCVVAVALIGWLGYSAYSSYESTKEREVVEVDYNPLTEYMTELQ